MDNNIIYGIGGIIVIFLIWFFFFRSIHRNYVEILDANWEGPKPLWDEVAGRIRNRAETWHASTINTIWW